MGRFHAVEVVKISDLRLPDDFSERLKDPALQSLAKSIEDVGLLHFPIVRQGSGELIAGGNRVAAHVLRGDKGIEVRYFSGNDFEVEEIRAAENAERRHGDRDKWIARLVAARAARIEAQRAELSPKLGHNTERQPAGRPTTSMGEAREQLAEELGTTTKALRRAEERAREAEALEAEAAADLAEGAAVKEPPKARIRTLGLKSPQIGLTVKAAEHSAEFLGEAIRGLELAKRKVSWLYNHEAMGPTVHRQLNADLLVLISAVKDLVPVSICPSCKLIQHLRKACLTCDQTGVVGESTIKRTDPALLVEGPDSAVYVDGRLMKVSALSQKNPAAEVEDHADDGLPF